MSETSSIKPLLFDTYLAVVKNSIRSHLFHNYFANVNGKKIDVLQDGTLSCAFFVSSILSMFNLIEKFHATVESTQQDLKKSRWVKIEKPKPGAVIVWEAVDFGEGQMHKHIGFYIGKNKAISNSDKEKHPVEHDWLFEGKRKVETIYWNPTVLGDSKSSHQF